MGSVTAVFRNGRIELAVPVDWLEGTQVEVTPLGSVPGRARWLSLPPLDVGEFRELNAEDDLLGEMLDDSRASHLLPGGDRAGLAHAPQHEPRAAPSAGSSGGQSRPGSTGPRRVRAFSTAQSHPNQNFRASVASA